MYFLDAGSGESLHTIDTGGPVVTAPMMYETAGGVWEAGTGSTDGTSYWWIPDSELTNVNTLPADGPIHASISSPGLRSKSIWYRTHGLTLERRLFDGSNRKVWTFEADGKIRTAPVLAGGVVHVGSWDGSVYAVDAKSGEQNWAFETDGKVNSSPAATGGALYVGSDDQHVYGIDAETGSSLWAYETGGPVVSSPAVVAGTLYVGSDDGSVYALAEPGN